MLELESMTALVIAPHPDDEIFGCGGTIHRWKSAGGKVYVLYMTVGTTVDFSDSGRSTAEQRMDETAQVARLLDFDGYALAFPGDQYHLRLDAVPQRDLVHAIERGGDISLQALRPVVVLAPSIADYNQDHRAIGLATMTAARPGPTKYKSFPPLVLTYELPYHQWNTAESLPMPGLFVTLEPPSMAAKIGALALYGSQLKSPESPLSVRGVETLATYRGLQCGAAAAEAFQIKRLVL
ncbi:MAG TPA: PIG-L family deacetylase [Haliangium sp.]|nr:PIG-L family deacetylase [Haliangium sp.]